MALVREILGELQFPPSASPEQLASAVRQVLTQAKTLKIDQLQQFFREMSHLLYQRQESSQMQLFVLMLAKELLISGDFTAYLFQNVYIFPWVVAVCNFQQEKSLEQRARLLYKENTGNNSAIAAASLETYKKLLDYAEEFLVFFGDNLKFYPYSKYKIKSSLARQLQIGSYKRSLTHFTNNDLSSLQGNLKKKGTTFRDDLSLFTDFINTKIQQCMENSSKFHDNLFLLLSLVETSDSYCISSIAFRLSSFFYPQKVVIACQMADYVISTAQIQAVQSINIRCLPMMLQYLLPVNFKENSIRERPKANLEADVLNRFIDYFYLWFEKTKLLKLSTKIYELCYPMIQYLKKPFKLSFQPQIREFKAHLQKIDQNNQVKRSFIIDQHQDEQQSILNLLKQAAFCVNSQKIQRQIAYENVLDDLTITEKESMSEFSESLLKSAKNRETGSSGHQSIQSDRENSGSRRNLKSSKLSSKRSKIHSHSNNSGLKEQIENVYYYNKNTTSKPSPKASQLRSFQHRSKEQRSGNNHCQSQAIVQYPSFPKVTSNDRGKPRETPDISFHSSQFSQKDNNDRNRPTQSVYLNRSQSKDRSGEFLYFEKQSEIRSVKEQKPQDSRNNQKDEKQQIEFHDSLRMANQSESGQLQQYGMDANAKIPQTVPKPKFNFKNAETRDSSILKGVFTPQNSSVVEPIQLTTSNKKEPPKFDESPILAYQLSNSQNVSNIRSLASRVSALDSKKSPPIVEKSKNDSSSIIKENSLQPHLISQSVSFSNDKLPSKFGEVFRQKSEKASVLSSSRSLRKLRRLPQRQVQIPDFKKLRDLENELGRLKKQTEEYNMQLSEKKKEMIRLEKQKMQIAESDPYYLKKQNEIMKILLKNKSKSPDILNSNSSAKTLAKELKESSIKNFNMSLKDYNPDILKLKFANLKAYSKEEKKNIISNRCILLKNELIEIGYSFKNNCVTLYLTLKNYCESLEINLIENSINFSESIRRSFDKLYVGKQMKFKTEVNATKESSTFIPSNVVVKLTYQHKLDVKTSEFTCDLPLTPYNIAQPLTETEGNSLLSQKKADTTPYITPLYNSSEDLLKKGKPYLLTLFPHGYFNEQGTVFTINYKWKDRIEVVNLKLKERAFRIQGTGYPIDTGRQLIETIINLLTEGS